MSEMVTRVAHIIEGAHPDESFHSVAKRAIEAMRKPTEAMIDAAATVERYAGPGEEWEPMIDSALED